MTEYRPQDGPPAYQPLSHSRQAVPVDCPPAAKLAAWYLLIMAGQALATAIGMTALATSRTMALPATLHSLPLAYVLLSTLPMLFGLPAAVGLFRCAHWAWWLAIVALVVQVLSGIGTQAINVWQWYSIIQSGSYMGVSGLISPISNIAFNLISGMIMTGVLIWALLHPEVRAAFWRTPEGHA